MAQPGDALPPQAPPKRETSIAQVMTSTSVGKHPSGLIATGLPILQAALNVELMTARLTTLLRPLAASGPPPVITYARLLAYKQGNRGAIRYELGGTDEDGVSALGKLYPQAEQAARVHLILTGLWGEVFRDADGLGVPRPLGHVPELSMLVYVPVAGQSLDDVLAVDPVAGERAVAQTAAWLASLHRARLDLDRRFQPATEMVNLEAWAALVGRTWPDQAISATRIAAGLRESASRLRLRADTPIHKDFHYKHVIVEGGLRVIDFDEVRLGDPAYDVAHFSAHLRLLACRTAGDAGALAGLERTFLDAYTDAGGQSSTALAAPVSWFGAYTCLKIAKQLCTTRGVRPRPDGDEQHRQVQAMLAQGLAFRGDD
jgi:aminoglycoside phosphotransferase (APT) family kinase protein